MAKRCIAILTAAIAILTTFSSADILEFKDGTLIEGQLMGATKNNIRIKVGDEVQTYSIDEVLSLTFTRPSSTQTEQSISPNQPVEEGTSQPLSEPNAISNPVTVPQGTRILVRTSEKLSSRENKSGHVFGAVLETPIVVDNQIIVPKGEKVYGRLVTSERAGRMAGKAKLKVVLSDIMIDGRPHEIITSSVRSSGNNALRNTVGTTAVGTGIGAIVGRGRGAGIGAAAGLGVSALTEGDQVEIPANTVLEFELVAPLNLTP